MLISIIVTLIVFGLLYYLVTLIPLPSPFPEIIRVVVIIVLVLWLAGLLLGHPIMGNGLLL